MRRLLQRTAAIVLFASAAAVTTGGCADNESSLYIAGVMKQEPPECDVRASISAPLILSGVLDVALSTEFRAVLLVGNQMAPRGDKDNLRTETSNAVLKGAEVRLENSVGETISEFTVPGAGTTLVNTARQAGYGAMGATLIPPNIGATYAASGANAVSPAEYVTLVANVRVFGDTLGGREIESAELSYPIRVCNGCTVLFDEVLGNGSDCDPNGEASIDPPCNPGQELISCVTCYPYSAACQCASRNANGECN